MKLYLLNNFSEERGLMHLQKGKIEEVEDSAEPFDAY